MPYFLLPFPPPLFKAKETVKKQLPCWPENFWYPTEQETHWHISQWREEKQTLRSRADRRAALTCTAGLLHTKPAHSATLLHVPTLKPLGMVSQPGNKYWRDAHHSMKPWGRSESALRVSQGLKYEWDRMQKAGFSKRHHPAPTDIFKTP